MRGWCGGFICISLMTAGVAASAQNLPNVVDPHAVTHPESVIGTPVDAADHAREIADRKQWNALRAEHRKEESTNPQNAIAVYQSFVTSRKLHPAVVITASDVVARLYLDKLKDAAHAAKIYSWLETNYNSHPAMAFSVPGRAALLNAQKNYQGAVDLLKANWDAVLNGNVLTHEYAIAGLRAWDEALVQLKSEEKIVAPMAKAFATIPLMLDDRDADSAWAYSTQIKVLLDAKHGKEALGWARLRFAATPYDTHHIAAASKQVSETWKKADPESKAWIEFDKAQLDGAQANPLLEIALPTLDETAWARALQLLTPGGIKYRHYVITLLIAKGDYGDAMRAAESITAHNPQSTLGVTEGCRVFKAAQLNLLGAAKLIESIKAGSSDPLQAFYQAHPPGTVKISFEDQ